MLDASCIKWSNLIYQAVQQCFVGTLLQFGFRICPASRTTSQNVPNSPFHLKSVVEFVHPSKCETCQVKGLPNLVACPLLSFYGSSQQIPTVRQILNELGYSHCKTTLSNFAWELLSNHWSLITQSLEDVTKKKWHLMDKCKENPLFIVHNRSISLWFHLWSWQDSHSSQLRVFICKRHQRHLIRHSWHNLLSASQVGFNLLGYFHNFTWHQRQS